MTRNVGVIGRRLIAFVGSVSRVFIEPGGKGSDNHSYVDLGTGDTGNSVENIFSVIREVSSNVEGGHRGQITIKNYCF